MRRTTALFAMLTLGTIGLGCAVAGDTASATDRLRPGAISSMEVNQGKFPTAPYTNIVQPNYALTGQTSTAWHPSNSIIFAGNARISIPANQ